MDGTPSTVCFPTVDRTGKPECIRQKISVESKVSYRKRWLAKGVCFCHKDLQKATKDWSKSLYRRYDNAVLWPQREYYLPPSLTSPHCLLALTLLDQRLRFPSEMQDTSPICATGFIDENFHIHPTPQFEDQLHQLLKWIINGHPLSVLIYPKTQPLSTDEQKLLASLDAADVTLHPAETLDELSEYWRQPIEHHEEQPHALADEPLPTSEHTSGIRYGLHLLGQRCFNKQRPVRSFFNLLFPIILVGILSSAFLADNDAFRHVGEDGGNMMNEWVNRLVKKRADDPPPPPLKNDQGQFDLEHLLSNHNSEKLAQHLIKEATPTALAATGWLYYQQQRSKKP